MHEHQRAGREIQIKLGCLFFVISVTNINTSGLVGVCQSSNCLNRNQLLFINSSKRYHNVIQSSVILLACCPEFIEMGDFGEADFRLSRKQTYILVYPSDIEDHSYVFHKKDTRGAVTRWICQNCTKLKKISRDIVKR